MPGWLSLIVGSIVGGVSRHAVSRALSPHAWGAHLPFQIPYGTLWVNLSGCFLIGVFHAWAEHRGGLSSETRLLLMTGFCGAYTTFSALILETSQFARGNHIAKAVLYVAASIVMGFILFRLGESLGKNF